ncbi:MAG: hypothetical protein U5L96_15280 [Owenweeksia sp.]|nr:hypothetical protein [Owenweeksia sp.]
MRQQSLLKRLLKDPLGAGGIIVILLAFFVALFAYAVVPDPTPDANQMHLAIAGKKPGFAVGMLRIEE